jgi:hypothetical protein
MLERREPGVVERNMHMREFARVSSMSTRLYRWPDRQSSNTSISCLLSSRLSSRLSLCSSLREVRIVSKHSQRAPPCTVAPAYQLVAPSTAVIKISLRKMKTPLSFSELSHSDPIRICSLTCVCSVWGRYGCSRGSWMTKVN